MSTLHVRSVLEYVPYFRKRLFIIHIAASLLSSRELVDALLDVDALHEVGVRLILIAEGGQEQVESLYTQALHCELHSARVEFTLAEDEEACLARTREIVERKQIALLASGVSSPYDPIIERMARQMKARKYVCLLDGEIPTRQGQPIFSILESEVAAATDCTQHEQLLQAAELCRAGIPRVHLLDGRHRGVLLDELFSEEGVGTMVHADSYREIRPLQLDDIPELLSMISRSVVDAKLVSRSYESILEDLHSYYVYTLDDTIVGCVALYPYPEEAAAELGCLYIKKHYEGHGYGKALCAMIEQKARECGFRRLFAVSQSAVRYFRDRLGYESIAREKLPMPRLRQLEESGRSSEAVGRDL